MEKISVSIICRNEEKNIEGCIESVSWADEIIVIDGFSEDKTPEIARKYTDKIFQNKWGGFSDQREFALIKCSNEWIFSLDADERCSPELAEELRSIVSSHSNTYTGFKIPRKSFFLGKWVRHSGWYPNYQLRFFRKRNIKVSGRLVHEKYELDGETGYLKNDLLHYTVQSINEYVSRVNHYSSLQALEKAKNRKVSFINLFLRPSLAFIQGYFFKGGFLDGITGLMVVNFHIITNILTYMKIWEIQHKKKQ